tara:strand:- start:296 stop:1153 length:858 start_codon:yes stop_codon:yes gene_type:complete
MLKERIEMNEKEQKTVSINNINFSNNNNFVLIAGPCVIESLDHAINMTGLISDICKKFKIDFVYKSSFDKANRTSIKSNRGIGLEQSLNIFKEVKKVFSCSIITDVHESSQCYEISKFVDILQIPAFLSRQTDLLISAANTKKAVMVKKGQFAAPWDMNNVVSKLEAAKCNKILLCERGASFGYNALVSDMRAIPIMQKTGYPVIFDATHSVQQPGGLGEKSGGQREFVPILARAAVAVGVAGIFLETHDSPDNAPSDGPNMIKVTELSFLLEKLLELDRIVKDK